MKLSERFKNTHEEIINTQYNIICKCTDELKTLYNNEEIDNTMLMGKVTHEFWNNFNCNDKPFLWGYDEATQKFYELDDATQNISNTTSVCLLRTSTHSTDANIGIDTTEENTTSNVMKLITDFDTNNLVLACYATNWDKSVSWWVDNTQRPTAWELLFKLFYKVSLGDGSVRLIDLTREVSIGIINDNKISTYLDYSTISKCSYAVTNNYGSNTLNFGLQGRFINNNFEWYGTQAKTSRNKTDDDKHYIDIGSSYYVSPYYRHPIINALQYPYIVDVIASLGLPFILCNPNTIETQSDFDNAVKIAYMDKNGNIDYNHILNGRTEINNSDTYNKDISYNNLPAIDNNTYTEKIDMNKYMDLSGNIFSRSYLLSADEIGQISALLDETIENYEPLKSVISLQSFPFGLLAIDESAYMSTLKIGSHTFSGHQYLTMTRQSGTINLGSCTVPRTFNNFLDYEPYTQISLYVPYCGTVSLSPSIVMGKRISVEMSIDITVGNCTAVIYANGIPISTMNGTISAHYCISSQEQGMKNQAKITSLLSLGGSAIGLSSSVASGNIVGAVASGYGTLVSGINTITNANRNYTESKGTTSGLSAFYLPQQPFIRISSPKLSENIGYGHTVGYISNEYKQISDVRGYTVCSNIDLSGINALSSEKEILKRILENGCYL